VVVAAGRHRGTATSDNRSDGKTYQNGGRPSSGGDVTNSAGGSCNQASAHRALRAAHNSTLSAPLRAAAHAHYRIYIAPRLNGGRIKEQWRKLGIHLCARVSRAAAALLRAHS